MMKITPITVTLKEIYDCYCNDDESEGGVVGYGERLDIRPPYQRSYVYKDKQRNLVIDTILKGLPLNVMYWAKKDEDKFEVLDGQQRTISFCEFMEGNFSVEYKGSPVYYEGLPADVKKKFDNYELSIYVCDGEPSEKLEWFKIINIAGEKLTDQELRNAAYPGRWLEDAKKYFSKTGCTAAKIGDKYVTGTPIRQEILEKALNWISNGKIKEYMASHQSLPNALELKTYYANMIEWIITTFKVYRKELKGQDWGRLYNEHKSDILDPDKIEEELSKLFSDYEIQNGKGIYEYIFDRKEKHLNLRQFDERIRRIKYEEQGGICPICHKHFEIEEMQADHIIPWSRGGKTEPENCQMLCEKCNKEKSAS